MYKTIKNKYILLLFIFFSTFIMSSISMSDSRVENLHTRNTGIVRIVENTNIKKYNESKVNTIDIGERAYRDTDSENISSKDFIENAANMLFANMMVISNQVGGRITTIIGVIIMTMFVLDISKMVLQSQLSQVSIASTLSQYFSRILTLSFVSAMLLIPIPNNMRYNGITNLFQWIINKMLSMWLHIGQLFFPDNIYAKLVTTSDITVPTATIPYIYKAGDVIPGKIAAEIVNLPLEVISIGIGKMASLWAFFSGLIFCIVGIYMLFKIIGIVSIFISAVFEFVVLLTLSSIYMPFMLLESTKDRIGNKPLELLLTQGIKVVVTTGLVGMLISLLNEGTLSIHTASFITIFMIAVAFSIMEKVINNNNQIATTILQGGGLGVSTGNEFFAMATQVGMMVGGAALIMSNGAVGNIKDFKENLSSGKSVRESLGSVVRNTSVGKEFGKMKDLGSGIRSFFRDVTDGKNISQSWKKMKAMVGEKQKGRDAEYFGVKSKHTGGLEKVGMSLQVLSLLTGDQQLMMLSGLLNSTFSEKAYKDSQMAAKSAAEAYESTASHFNGSKVDFEFTSGTSNVDNSANVSSGNSNGRSRDSHSSNIGDRGNERNNSTSENETEI